MKVIGLVVHFLKIVKLWRLSTEFYGVGQKEIPEALGTFLKM